MFKAITLVHKGAMEIAVHSIRSFARHFSSTHTLVIHTDPSVNEADQHLLLEAASGMQASIVDSKERSEKIMQLLQSYPKTKALITRGTFYTKLEVPMFEEAPYFFFDSDIVWLKPVVSFVPLSRPNAFSTESWTWYNGIANARQWIRARTPRRVNSGFHYLGEAFPYKKLEDMLVKGMFDAAKNCATDQEIFAYLYNEMEYYHPEDLKRSRVGSVYNMSDEKCAALHFPGKMWSAHLDQIEQLFKADKEAAMSIRYQPAVPLTNAELLRMRAQVRMGNSTLLAKPLNLVRKLLRAYR
jgi:hypothetical protein